MFSGWFNATGSEHETPIREQEDVLANRKQFESTSVSLKYVNIFFIRKFYLD